MQETTLTMCGAQKLQDIDVCSYFHYEKPTVHLFSIVNEKQEKINKRGINN